MLQNYGEPPFLTPARCELCGGRLKYRPPADHGPADGGAHRRTPSPRRASRAVGYPSIAARTPFYQLPYREMDNTKADAAPCSGQPHSGDDSSAGTISYPKVIFLLWKTENRHPSGSLLRFDQEDRTVSYNSNFPHTRSAAASCLECGAKMRLTTIIVGYDGEAEIAFDRSCGFKVQQSQDSAAEHKQVAVA